MATQTDQVQAGWSVHDREGDKIGDIEEVGENYLLVTKGLIFTTDIYVPLAEVEEVDADEGHVFLGIAKAEVDGMGWTDAPAAASTDQAGSGSIAGLGYTGRDATDDSTAFGRATTDETVEGVGYTGAEATEDRISVPVHEEELHARRTRESAGEVRVRKDVLEEEQSIDVPVTREEVEVRRVPVDRAAGADETAFTDGDTIRVPVTAERVEVTKEPRIVEEIEISKRPVTETETVSDTVRRERVEVEEAGGVLAGAGASSISGAGDEMRDTGASGMSRSTFDGDDATEAGGAAAGAVGGAVIGGAVGGPPGAVIGGAIGAAGGAVAGDKVDGDEADDRDDLR